MSKRKSRHGLKPDLRNLLLSNQEGNKEDLRVYIHGHLNPRFLAKLPSIPKESTSIWESSSKKQNLPVLGPTTSFELSSPLEKVDFHESYHSNQKEECLQQSRVKVKLKEELQLPEIMLPRSTFRSSIEEAKETIGQKEEFVTSHLAGVTSKDQYFKMLDFRDKLFKRNDEVQSGISFWEEKLINGIIDLQTTPTKSDDANFGKLALYADVWNDMIRDSTIYGQLLSDIKKEYDQHLENCMHLSQVSNAKEVIRSYQLINDLSTSGNADDYKEIKQEVEELEAKCQQALLRNADLNTELQKEVELMLEEEEEHNKVNHLLKWSFSYWRANVIKKLVEKQKAEKNKNERLKNKRNFQALRNDILTNLDILEKEKKIIKENFVPKQQLQILYDAKKDIQNDINKALQSYKITLVLNMEKKEKIMEFINVSKTHQEINLFGDIEKEIARIEVVPKGEMDNVTELQKSLIKPDLVEEFINKINTMEIDF